MQPPESEPPSPQSYALVLPAATVETPVVVEIRTGRSLDRTVLSPAAERATGHLCKALGLPSPELKVVADRELERDAFEIAVDGVTRVAGTVTGMEALSGRYCRRTHGPASDRTQTITRLLYKGSPGVFYPSGERNFVRVTVRDDLQGVAQTLLAKQLGLRRVYVLAHPEQGLDSAVSKQFVRVARRLGIAIAGAADVDRMARSYGALADKVARSGADGVILNADQYAGGAELLTALRARVGPRVTLIAGEGFSYVRDLRKEAGRAARGLYVTVPIVPPDAARLSPDQERFVGGLGESAGTAYLLHAVQATEVVLAAIARSDGTRASVLREAKGARVRDGFLGSFAFDRNGDITPAKVTVLRVTGDTPPDLRLPGYLAGADVHRVVTVPASLAG